MRGDLIARAAGTGSSERCAIERQRDDRARKRGELSAKREQAGCFLRPIEQRLALAGSGAMRA